MKNQGPSVELVNLNTVMNGPGPSWLVGEFTVSSGQAVKLTGYGLGAADKVCIRQLYKKQEGASTHRDKGCANSDPGAMKTVASVPYTYCGEPVCFCAAQPILRIRDAGIYILEVSGPAFASRTAIVTADQIAPADVTDALLATQCTACKPAVVQAPPVTASITGLSAPLPPSFIWQGAIYTPSSFVAAVQAQVPGAIYNTATGVFTAPAGSLFPGLDLSPAPSVVIAGGAGQPACPISLPVTYAGNAYNSIANLKAAIETDQGVLLSWSPATCTFTQIGGAGTLVNPNVTLATAIPVTGLPCPLVFPFVWNQDGNTYTGQGLFKAAVDAYYGLTSQYDAAACTFTVLTGDVLPLPVVSVSAVPPVVTASITPCPANFPLVWAVDGLTYSSVVAFKVALQNYMSVPLTYSAIGCTFTAPFGSVFPSLALSPPAIGGVVYCPSIPLLGGGYGFHIADSKDPAATVELTPCPGDLSLDSIWLYPTAAPGRTAKVLGCDGVAIGYGVNVSDCAVQCNDVCATCKTPPPPPPPLRALIVSAAITPQFIEVNVGSANLLVSLSQLIPNITQGVHMALTGLVGYTSPAFSSGTVIVSADANGLGTANFTLHPSTVAPNAAVTVSVVGSNSVVATGIIIDASF